MKNKYKVDLSINKFKIDEELLKQPQLYYEWTQLSLEAEVEKDNAKDNYDLLVEEIENKVRQDPERYLGDNKPTEGAIKSYVKSHPKVRKYYKRFAKARNEWKLLSKAEKAFDQRKKMLESYLYHIHHEKNSEVKVPREYEKRFNQETKRDIEDQLKTSIRRR